MNKQLKILLGIVLVLGITLIVPAGVKAETVGFSHLSHDRTGGRFSFGGVVDVNSLPHGQVHVRLFCHNQEVADGLSSVDGSFNLITNDCFTGDDAYLEVDHDGATSESTHCQVPRGRHGGIFTPDPTAPQDPAEVPEFGVIAGAVALVGALGIFAFRRKN